jgi:glutamate-5-semialdehyde dehydrogenase
MAVTVPSVAELCRGAREASRALAVLDTATKDAALHAVARALEDRTPEILEANTRDLAAGREAGLSAALLDRLALDDVRVAALAAGVRAIAALPDPVVRSSTARACPTGSTCARSACPWASWRSCTRRGRT